MAYSHAWTFAATQIRPFNSALGACMISRKFMAWLAMLLLVLLVVTNVWWLYQSIDSGVTEHYRTEELREHSEVLQQLQKLLPVVKPSLSKTEIVSKAEMLYDSESFEKDGCVWVGLLGLQFNEDDRLIHVSHIWNYGETDPCFP